MAGEIDDGKEYSIYKLFDQATNQLLALIVIDKNYCSTTTVVL